VGEALDQPSKSEAANDAFHGSELEQRRERLRRRFLRANTAVGVILLAVLGLALASVLAGIRAERNQRRAEAAEQLAREQLWRAYLSQARAARLDKHMGRRTAALAAITEATSIRPADELRDEAIAALALTDLESELAFTPIQRQHGYCAFLSNLTACVVGDYHGRFELHRLPDHQKLLELDATATAIGTNRLLFDCLASKDGRFFAASFKDGAVALWETEKGQPLRSCPRKIRGCWNGIHRRRKSLRIQRHRPRRALRIIDLPAGTDHPMARRLQPQAFSFRAGTSQIAVSDSHEIRGGFETGGVARTRLRRVRFRLVWSPDGQKLAGITAGDDIYLWLLDTGELRVKRPFGSFGARFSPASDL
jgi:type II secretory pathway pseudopilin PulG